MGTCVEGLDYDYCFFFSCSEPERQRLKRIIVKSEQQEIYHSADSIVMFNDKSKMDLNGIVFTIIQATISFSLNPSAPQWFNLSIGQEIRLK